VRESVSPSHTANFVAISHRHETSAEQNPADSEIIATGSFAVAHRNDV